MELPLDRHSRRRKPGSRRPKHCQTCKDFDWDELQRHEWSVYFVQPGELTQSAANGCVTCNILSKAVDHCYPHVRTPSESASYKIAFHGMDGPMHWDVVHPGVDVMDVLRKPNFVELYSSSGMDAAPHLHIS
jgi:hypothetical protein